MTYSLYHIISTTIMESNSTLNCLDGYLKGERVFTETELIDLINSVKVLNNRLHEASNQVIGDINKEVF